ncbi:heavy metal translocating P-type ATPase [Halocatena halophila]|uniref:heavy metal translocating P-type ATPase n=1 Tax=Halocatena halophila TaxID=2814576 RepID=UPI002ED0BFF0
MQSCTLCELPIDGEPITDGDAVYCCRGCQEIAELIEEPSSSVSIEGIRNRVQTGSDAMSVPDGAETVYRSVDGMHCKTCEGFIELLAEETDGVYTTDASYSNEMVRVVYDPDELDESAVTDAVSKFGYQARDPESTDEPSLLNRLSFDRYRSVISVILAMPVMFPYLLFIYPVTLGVYDDSFLLGQTMGAMVFGPLAVWSTLIVIGLGYPFFRGAYVSLRVGQPTMDVLVAIAVLAAYGYSVVTVATGGTHPYFDVAVMVLVVVTVGNHIESRVKRSAAGSRGSLTETRITHAERLRDDGQTETVPIDECAPGDRLLVRPGERIPVDGTVVAGTAAVDESLITGESVPETKRSGDDVLGGSVVTDSSLTVAVGPEATSTIDRLVSLMWQTKSRDGGVQRLVNRFAVVFVPLVLLIAFGTTVGWLLVGESLGTALMVGVSVLVISCPCSLGIATPLALSAGSRDGADNGILLLNETILERIDDSEVIVFDKTGTLTTGEMRVADVVADDPAAVRSRAAAVERHSSHPIADAICSATDAATVSATAFERSARSVSGVVDGERVRVGHPDAFAGAFEIPDSLQATIDDAYDDGLHPTVVGWAGAVHGVILLHDEPREEYERVLSSLATADREIVVLTGDDERIAARFGDHPAVDHVFAGVRPDSKRAIVSGLRERGTTTMVGDGTNDAPALASADLGIAVASATDLAVDAADAVIVDDSLEGVERTFELARATRGRIKRNLVWAALYNVIAIPIAVLGWITPLLAAAAMAISSLLVVFNSRRRLL